LLLVVLLGFRGALRADEVQQRLEAQIKQHEGQVALYAKNLKTGAEVAINADTLVKTASVIKLPIMYTAFALAKAGKLDLTQRVTLTKENQVPGSGVLTALAPGLQLTVEDAIVLMIQLSDNTATNLVIDRVGIDAVNQQIAAMGLKNTYLYKKVFKPASGPVPPDQPKFGLGKTTAREMAEAMAAIEHCDLQDKKLCDRMLAILKGQHDRDDIPRYIEYSDTSEKPSAIANKTGALDDTRNDVALLYTTAGPIVISIFTTENKDQSWSADNKAQTLIGRLAKTVVEAWAPRGLAPAKK
jgi:beta-lactamase class A